MSPVFHTELARIWQSAVDLYSLGKTDADTFPIDQEIPILSSLGMSKIDVFDYAEDWCLHQTPDLLTFILVHYERWSFFTEEQNNIPSDKRLDPKDLPDKTKHIRGILWLPRILPKARAKLKGELPDGVMFGCGGDRQFFQSNHIHPAQFLRLVRRFGDNDEAIIEWVETRKNQSII